MDNREPIHTRVLFIDYQQDRNTHCIDSFSGYLIDTVTTQDEAIVRLQQTAYDLILLALSSSDQTWRTSLRSLRNIAKHTPPIVLLVTHTDVREAVEGITDGAMDFIFKPITPAKIQSIVKKIRTPPPPAERAHIATTPPNEEISPSITTSSQTRVEVAIPLWSRIIQGIPEAALITSLGIVIAGLSVIMLALSPEGIAPLARAYLLIGGSLVTLTGGQILYIQLFSSSIFSGLQRSRHISKCGIVIGSCVYVLGTALVIQWITQGSSGEMLETLLAQGLARFLVLLLGLQLVTNAMFAYRHITSAQSSPKPNTA